MKHMISIAISEIQSIPVDVRTGPDIGRLVLATAWLKDGRIYDILFDQSGELITVHEKIKPLSEFFNKSFVPASLDGVNCLINIVDPQTQFNEIQNPNRN